MTCCPTCGHKVEPKEIFVDLIDNLLAVGGKSARLKPRSAELAAVLVTRMPNWSDSEYLRGRLTGDDDKETSDHWPQVRICLLRKEIAGLPLAIETQYGNGWRLVHKEAA